jgi:hypothetical protein
MRISPWCPLRSVPDDDGNTYVFETTEEDLPGTTATKGKVAEIATESVTTFERILIVEDAEYRSLRQKWQMRRILVGRREMIK